jgi:hypothetical protein
LFIRKTQAKASDRQGLQRNDKSIRASPLLDRSWVSARARRENEVRVQVAVLAMALAALVGHGRARCEDGAEPGAADFGTRNARRGR